MTRHAIGGRLDLDALARLHRPLDAPTLRAAAVELRSRGLTEQDIAAALGLTPAAVRQLLAPVQEIQP